MAYDQQKSQTKFFVVKCGANEGNRHLWVQNGATYRVFQRFSYRTGTAPVVLLPVYHVCGLRNACRVDHCNVYDHR